MTYFVHKSSYVDDSVLIGEDTKSKKKYIIVMLKGEAQ